MTRIVRNRHVLAVPDLERSAAWYRDALGFEVETIPDPGWRFVHRDAVTIMLGACPDAIPPQDLGDHQYFAYLEVDDVDAFATRLREHGADVIRAPEDMAWGMRECAVRTVDGHRLMLGQAIG